MKIKSLFKKLKQIDKCIFLEWVMEKYTNTYEYCNIPSHIRVYYPGPRQEYDTKSLGGRKGIICLE